MFITGCNVSSENNKIEEIALEEAKKITSIEGYSLESEIFSESDVFDFIKEASIEGGYTQEDLDSMTGNRKVVAYKLKEESKENMPIMLCLVIDKNKVIGAYLDYEGYYPGIAPINFKEYMK